MEDARWTWYRELDLVHLRLGEPARRRIRVTTGAGRAVVGEAAPGERRSWTLAPGDSEAWLRAPSPDGFLLRVEGEGLSARSYTFDRSLRVWVDWTLQADGDGADASRLEGRHERFRIRGISQISVDLDLASGREVSGARIPARGAPLVRRSAHRLRSSEQLQALPAGSGPSLRPHLWHEWILSPYHGDLVGPSLRIWKPPAGSYLTAEFRPARTARSFPTLALDAHLGAGFASEKLVCWKVRIVSQPYQGDTRPTAAIHPVTGEDIQDLAALSIYDRIAVEPTPGIPILATTRSIGGAAVPLPEASVRYLGELGGGRPFRPEENWYPRVLADARDATTRDSLLEIEAYKSAWTDTLGARCGPLHSALRRTLRANAEEGDGAWLQDALLRLGRLPLIVLERLLLLFGERERLGTIAMDLDVDGIHELIPLSYTDPAVVLGASQGIGGRRAGARDGA